MTSYCRLLNFHGTGAKKDISNASIVFTNYECYAGLDATQERKMFATNSGGTWIQNSTLVHRVTNDCHIYAKGYFSI